MKIRDMAICGLFAALLAICAWLSIPVGDSVISLQTFGVFLVLGLLGGKRGCITIVTYLLLGAVGLPVFSGFRGGFGALLGPTGGYLIGFLAMGLVYWAVPKKLPAMLVGLFTCYLFGTLWYYGFYLHSGNSGNLFVVFCICVLPYILPDLLKLGLAWVLTKRLKHHL